jgi:hypothetical protein
VSANSKVRLGPILASIGFALAGALLLVPSVPLWLRLGLVGLAAGALLGQVRGVRTRAGSAGLAVDGEGVEELRAGQVVGRIDWAELVAVSIIRIVEGPWAPDYSWVLHDAHGRQLVVPLDRAAETSLLVRLGRLPGFDHAAVIRATGGRDGAAEHSCWQGQPGDGRAAAGELDETG